MDEPALRQLLDDVSTGAVGPDEAVARLRRLPFADLGFARVDHHRLLRQGLAEAVYAPGNVRGAALVVACAGKGFDLGRAAQNMMLVAWNDGVASCPNGIRDAGRAARALDLREGEELGIVLTFGYLDRPRDPASRTAEEWSARANRRPLHEVARRL